MKTNQDCCHAFSVHCVKFCLVIVPALLITGFTEKSLTANETDSGDRPPNVVFILVDDLGWTDVGCFGSSFYQTPNIDALATSGMKMTNAYAACQVCSPTRASILTGRYPQRMGITDFIDAGGGNQPENWKRNTRMLPAPYCDHLPLEEFTIAERLKSAGYATFFAGKWHLGNEGFWPEDQGFDVNMGGIERGGPYGGDKYFSPYGNPRLADGPDGEHLPDRLATETVRFMTENKDKPFLAYLSFYSVHTPLMGREDLVAKYDELKTRMLIEGPVWGKEGERKLRLVQEHAVYAAMVEAMDEAVGKVITAIDELGLSENTIVIFTSDNGGLSTSEGHPTSNLPLRGGKGWMYEGGIREPTIIRAPGVTTPDSISTVAFSSIDYFPTILELTGVEAEQAESPEIESLEAESHESTEQPEASPEAPKLDGVSIVPALRGQAFNRGPIFWHYPHYGNQGGSPSAAVLDGNMKLIHWFEDDTYSLYDLAADLSEQNNLIEQQLDDAERLKILLSDWQTDVGAKFPTQK